MNRFLQISAAVVFSTMLLSSCSQDPIEEIGYVSNERAIESFSVAGQVGEAEITRTVDQAEVVVTVLETVDLTCVTPEIMVSLGATVEPASGEPVNFADNGNTMKYTVTSESGKTREWTVKIEVFSIPSWINRTWKLSQPCASGGSPAQNYTVTGEQAANYPGTNPLGKLTDHLDTKGYMFFMMTKNSMYKYTRPMSFFKFANYIPSIMDEYDNVLTFTFTGLNEDATAVNGEVEFSAGDDGKYARFPDVTYHGADGDVLIDFEKLYRFIPAGKGTFTYDLVNSVLTIYDEDGELYSTTSTRGTVIANNGSTVVTVTDAFTYDEAAGTLQLRYQPEDQALATEDSKMSSYDFSIPWVDLSTNSATGTGVFQMSSPAEVWYDFVAVE